MATLCADLSEAFFDSFIYWMQNHGAITTPFPNEIVLMNPDLNISKLTPPFIVVTHYDTADDIVVQPDIAYRPLSEIHESRNIRYLFTIGVYCRSFAEQRDYPYLVKREIERETTIVGSLHKDGFPVYQTWTIAGSVPDTSEQLCVAAPVLGGPYPLGGDEEEDEVRKWRSMIDGYWETSKDKIKVFITTNT